MSAPPSVCELAQAAAPARLEAVDPAAFARMRIHPEGAVIGLEP